MSRAKRVIKKKVPIIRIILLITLVGGIIAGILSYNPQIRQEIASLIVGKVESYDINDCIKAAYTEDGKRYIPIYYNNYKEQITAQDIISKFNAKGVEVESISSTTIGTGTVIKTKSTALGQAYTSSYTIVIYGDVNGDGKVNVLDINRIVEYYLSKKEGSNNLTGAYAKAANVEEIAKNQIDVLDINRIVGFMFSDNAVVEVLPYADSNPRIDKIAPTIELNGTSPVRVIVGENYVEQGVKVTDNLDPHVKITADPDPNGIDTSYEHTVPITYKAEDAAGNTSTIQRQVIIEEKSDVKITLEDPSEYVAVEYGDEVAYNALKLGATAINVKDNASIEPIPTWSPEELDINKPGIYTLTYTATNLQGSSDTAHKVIEVVDPITSITLDARKAEERYNGKEILEDSKIDLDDVMVTITRKDAGEQSAIPIRELLETYKKQFVAKVDEFNGKIVKYDSTNLKNNINKTLTANLTWTNPAKTGSTPIIGTASLGTVNIIGKIREIVPPETQKTSGNIYKKMPVAIFETPETQDKFSEIGNNVLKARFITEGGKKTGVCDISVKDGVATLNFWGKDEGIYQIEVYVESEKAESGEAKYTLKPITLTKDETPNRVIITNTNNKSFLKAAGEAGEYSLAFKHVYINPDTKEEVKTFPVSADLNKITVGYDTEGYLTSNIKENSEGMVMLSLMPSDKDIQDYTDITVTMSIDGERMDLSIDNRVQPFIVKIKTKSEYTLKFNDASDIQYIPEAAVVTGQATNVQSKNIALSYKKINQGTGEGATVTPSGSMPYKLYGVKLKDQHGDYADVKYEMLGKDATDSNIKITFDDGTNVSDENITNVIGFTSELKPCAPGEIVSYIGIGIKSVSDGTEDELLKEAGNKIKVMQGNNANSKVVALLNINNVEKNDITTITKRLDKEVQTKALDYRYSTVSKEDKRPNIIAQIKSGAGEKDLTEEDLSFKVAKKTSPAQDIVSNMTIYNEISENGLGRMNIRFRSPEAGIYIVTISLKNKPEINTSLEIEIKEDPRINKIMFETKKGQDTEFGTISNEVGLIRQIVYCHDYSEAVGEEIPPVEVADEYRPGRQSVTITPKTSDLVIKPTQGRLEIQNSDNDTVTGLSAKYTGNSTTSTRKFDMTIEQNITGIGAYTAEIKDITVNISPKVEIKTVHLERIVDDENKLYYYEPDNNYEGTWNYSNNTYSIFKIYYEYANGEESAIKASEISTDSATDAKVFIATDKTIEDGYPDYLTNIAVKPLNKLEKPNSEGESYELAGATNLVEYVGIALTDATTILGKPTKIKIYADTDIHQGMLDLPCTNSINIKIGNSLSKSFEKRAAVMKANALNTLVPDVKDEPIDTDTDEPVIDQGGEETLPNVSRDNESLPNEGTTIPTVEPSNSETDKEAETETKTEPKATEGGNKSSEASGKSEMTSSDTPSKSLDSTIAETEGTKTNNDSQEKSKLNKE